MTLQRAGDGNRIVVGVDGCKGGWIAALLDLAEHDMEFRTFGAFPDLLAAFPKPTIIGVDVPIGLATGVPRACDISARKLLGFPKSAAVFPSPDRRILNCLPYDEANARSKSLTGKGISRQTFGIMPKIAEVDAAMTPDLQRRVIEVHPEVGFRALNNGQAMTWSKKKIAGFAARRVLLLGEFPWLTLPPTGPEVKAMAGGVPADDVLDAIVAAWSAARFARGTSVSLPARPELDSRGLGMAITY